MSPLISILMPTYNHERFIAQAIESALKQKTEYSYELLINDDCSKDNTAEIAEKYANEYPNIIHLFRQKENLGLMKSYKFLLEHACGKYIAILESDDYYLDEYKLQKQISFLEQNADFGICTSEVQLVDENNNPLELITTQDDAGLNGDWYNRLLFTNFIRGGVSICFRQELYKKYVNIDDYIALSFITFDYPLLLTLSAHSKCKYIHEPLAAYRILGTSISNNSSYKKAVLFEESILSIKKYIMDSNPDIPFTQYSKTDILNYQFHVLMEKAWKNRQVKDFCAFSKNIIVTNFRTFVLRFFPRFWYYQHILRFSK